MRSNPISIGIAALIVTAMLALCCFAYFDSMPQEPEQEEDTPALVVDTSNAATMHKYGLPTKSDVMAFHVYGHWGYYDGGDVRLFAELPGSKHTWDRLYGIEPNKAFKY